jgi:hypothetical protein
MAINVRAVVNPRRIVPKPGRRIKKGEECIRILAPVIGCRRKKETEASKDSALITKAMLVGFHSAAGFGGAQTEGGLRRQMQICLSGSDVERTLCLIHRSQPPQ